MNWNKIINAKVVIWE